MVPHPLHYLICKVCARSRNNGFACDHYAGYCFGRFRTVTATRCPAERW
jgi:hypothetical protein